ncbi:MAG: hypothetical protein EB082_16480, partial [Verrucomicrobia bacterium]|nr:hypothetical protein [Verrucomicrobiota bacterium]
MKLAAVEYDSVGGHIWTSADAGATWTQRKGGTSFFWESIASSADGTKLAAVEHDDVGGGIWTST